MKNNVKDLFVLLLSMLIFGTVGIFSKNIALPTGVIAFFRSAIGLIFLLILMLIFGKRPDTAAIRKNLWLLLISGIALAANWVLFFEACRYTTVPTATVSYYLAPVMLIAISPLLFGEKLTPQRVAFALVAVVGMLLSSGVFGSAAEGVSAFGIMLGVLAAVLYASVIAMNKLMKDIDPLLKTACQFAVSAAVLLPYAFLFEDMANISFSSESVIYLLIIGIIHTGLAYALYFRSATVLPAATTAIISYIDPVTSIIISTVAFGEPLGVQGAIGAALIIAAAVLGESLPLLTLKNKEKTK